MTETRKNRIEHDIIGDVDILQNSLMGIHTYRAVQNFAQIGGPVNPGLISAYGYVKLACANTNHFLGYIPDKKFEVIKQACSEMSEGILGNDCQLAALQGGAGTSTNMYVNEVIANRALILSNKTPGDYDYISPYNHINLHQSTNDTYPTALKVAAMIAGTQLETAVSELVEAFQEKERQFSSVVKLGRTQLQDAIPLTASQQISSYTEALSKDRWRIYKIKERLRTVNLGGTAIGTGLGAPTKYIFMVTDELRKLINQPIARAENLVQATQNLDEIVEASAILKTLATNLFKISSDIILLSSGPDAGFNELKIPARQAGSSIMPGKINPVIAEMVSQVAMQAISRESAISMAAMNGKLELNAFMPLIAHNLLSMIDELSIACNKMRELLILDMQINEESCRKNLHSSTAVITAFINQIGYDRASEIASQSQITGKTIKEIMLNQNLCTEDEYNYLTSSDAVLSLGFREKRKK